jgi:hypothetical protein
MHPFCNVVLRHKAFEGVVEFSERISTYICLYEKHAKVRLSPLPQKIYMTKQEKEEKFCFRTFLSLDSNFE